VHTLGCEWFGYVPRAIDEEALCGVGRSALERYDADRPHLNGHFDRQDLHRQPLSATVMETPGVADIVNSRSASRNYENLKGIGQKMEVHRIAITPTQT
jgi:hypothetical protein